MVLLSAASQRNLRYDRSKYALRRCRCCQPLTVLTQCYFTLSRGVNFTSRRDLCETFFAKVKLLLDLEAGKPSLPTAQALLVMFSYCCFLGRDRAGNIFRAAGYEMMEPMMPKTERAISNKTCPSASHQAITRAIWGMFCFDR